jgi:hypothetical protein
LPAGRNYWEHSVRPTTGGATIGLPGAVNFTNAWTGGGNLTTGGNLNYFGTPRPAPFNWGRVRRYNNVFTYYVSSNGVNWIQTAQIFQSMNATAHVGMGLTVHFNAANYAASAQFRDFGDVSYPGAVITGPAITPTTTNINAFGTATFVASASVSVAPASELQYQWQRSNGVGGYTNIPGALATSVYTTPILTEADSGSSWRAVIKVTSATSVATPAGTVTIGDTNKPFVTIAYQGNPTAFAATFSEPVEAASALNTGNYTLTAAGGGAMTINSAYFYTNGAFRVILSTAQPLTNGNYTFTAANVRDRAVSPSGPNTMTNTTLTLSVTTLALGQVERRQFTALTGGVMSDLTNSAKFIANTPDVVDFPSNIDQNADIGDNYGQQFRGYFVAPRTGTNIFWVSSDDASELWLSSDENPANKVLIAREEVWNNGRDWLQTARRTTNPDTGFLYNRSGTNLNGTHASITATTIAGNRYFFEYLHKEGTGGDRATVYVQLPGDAAPAAAAVPNIGPFMTLLGTLSPVAFTQQPASASAYVGTRATFSALATAFPGAQYRWQRNGVDIPGATGRTYTTPYLTAADNGALYRAVAYNAFSSATSDSATLTVNTDTTWVFTPGLVKVELFTGTGGTLVSDLRNMAKFINNTPDTILYTNIFAWNQGIGNSGLDNYGARVSAYFVAPSNGNYRFFLRSDDMSELSMTTDSADSLNADKRVVIAQQSTACCRSYGDNSGGPNTSGAIPLNGGQLYYMEALFKEGIGGDGVTVTWRPASETFSPTNSEAAWGGYFVTADIPSGAPTPITIVQQPQSLGDLLENRTATFTVLATNSVGALQGYQWQKNGVDIAGAINSSYTTPRLTSSDSLAIYTVKVLMPGRVGVLSDPASVGTILADADGPLVAAAFGDPVHKNIRVVFDEPVNATDAGTLANYNFTGGTVTNASLLADGKTVILTLDSAPPQAQYTLEALGIRDLVGNQTPSSTSDSFTAPWITTNGVVFREAFFGNSTTLPYNFSTLTNNPNFPSAPGLTDYLTNFFSPQSGGGAPGFENYSVRVKGFILPPVTGNYTFQVLADDAGWLLLSPDAEATNALTLIKSEGIGCAACNYPQTGNGRFREPLAPIATVRLEAGKAYYAEALMMEGGGGDYIQIAWRPPGATSFSIIPGTNIVFGINPDAVTLEITSQPTDQQVFERRTATFAVSATATGPVVYQWQTFSGDWVNIPDGTNRTYRITPTDSATQHGLMFRVVVSLGGGLIDLSETSDEVMLLVDDDIVSPTAVRTYSLSGKTIKVVFDEDLDAAIATDPASYPNAIGSSYVTGFTLQADNAGVSNTVLLSLDTELTSSTYTITAFSADGGGNFGEFSASGNVFALGTGLIDDGPVGTAADPLEKGSTEVPDPNRLVVTAGGSDIWNAADGFRYAWGTYTNDFDVKVRVSRLDPRNTWSKAGFVVREDFAANGRNVNAVLTPFSNTLALDGSATPVNDYEAGARGAVGSSTLDWRTNSVCCVTNLGGRPTNSPPYTNAWIRLRRTGNDFRAYFGTNGINWSVYANTNQSFGSVVILGLGTTSHNNSPGVTTTAEYNDFAIIRPPTITTPPVSQHVVQNNMAVFNVVATGEEPLLYQWRKGGSPLLGEIGTSLTIASAQASDDADYDVVVSNVAGSVTSSPPAHLTVHIAPGITTEPGDLPIECSGDAVFSVVASGNPLFYQWYYNTNTVLMNETNATLTLDNVTAANNGTYSVIITNLAGIVESRYARLAVSDTVDPVLGACPANQVICTSSNTARAFYALPSATDACDPAPVVVCSPPSGTELAIGVSSIICTATDDSGNTDDCVFTVTVFKAAAPTLSIVSYASPVFTASFASETGCTYLFQYKNAFTDPEWITIDTVAGNGAVKTVQDTTASVPNRFYQIKVQ